VKIFVRDIVSLFLAAIVLIATSGFTIFHHSCQTSQTSELSLIIPDFSCSHFQQKANDGHSCCSKHESPITETCGDDKCCNTETFLVKLDITLKVTNLENKISFSTPDFAFKTATEIEVPNDELSHITIINGLPPPLAGKDLHIFLHQLNIPFPSV